MAKVNIKKKIIFVRFGEVSPKKQDGYVDESDKFHSPPAKKGIFLFVYPHIQRFLLTSRKFLPYRMEWVRDKKGNRIQCITGKELPKKKISLHSRDIFDYGVSYIDYARSNKYFTITEGDKIFYAKHKKQKFINHTGDIWHHFDDIPPNKILARKNGWVKSTYYDYKRALLRYLGLNTIICKRHGFGFSKDCLEVFIENPRKEYYGKS